MPPPPDDADDVAAGLLDEVPNDASSRELTEHLTESSQACAGCHQAFINPIGFALGGFDNLGRQRAEERVYSQDGDLVATHQVNASAKPQIWPNDQGSVSSAADLIEKIAASGKIEACIARQYTRFAFSRLEQTEADACVIRTGSK